MQGHEGPQVHHHHGSHACVPCEQEGAEQFEHAAKEALREKLAQRGSIRGAHDVSATINAFRRRIDLVLPLTEAVEQA